MDFSSPRSERAQQSGKVDTSNLKGVCFLAVSQINWMVPFGPDVEVQLRGCQKDPKLVLPADAWDEVQWMRCEFDASRFVITCRYLLRRPALPKLQSRRSSGALSSC